MGADEQFGGYMRHRTTLKNHGWEALCVQLQMELERIPSRNLGRDDRVISHHGRQPRMPFLDEGVINFVKSLPPWERYIPLPIFNSMSELLFMLSGLYIFVFSLGAVLMICFHAVLVISYS